MAAIDSAQQFAHDIARRVTAHKARNKPRAPGLRDAAVLIPLLDDHNQLQVVFTKRTSTLLHHAGQMSFPGGMADPDDPDLEYTALRETHEEIGIAPSQVEVLAELNKVYTQTGFAITPFLSLLKGPDIHFKPNPAEVDKIVLAPLTKILNPRNYHPVQMPVDDGVRTWCGLEHQGEVIWGATIRILLDLLDALGTPIVMDPKVFYGA